jgi:hypothetical protein
MQPSRTSQGGWSKTTYDPRLTGKMVEGIGAGADIAGQAAGAARGYAGQQQEMSAKLSQQLEDARNDTMLERAKVQEKLDPQEAKLLELAERVQNGKVDPDQFFNERTDGQKAAMLLGAMIGGFTEGFTLGKVKNRSIDIIQRQIDTNINAQKANLQASAGALSAQQGIVSAFYRKLGDVDRAAEMGRIAMWDAYKAKASGIAAAEKSTAAAYQAQMFQNQASLQQLKLLRDSTAVRRTGGSTTKTMTRGEAEMQRAKLGLMQSQAQLMSAKAAGKAAKGGAKLPAGQGDKLAAAISSVDTGEQALKQAEKLHFWAGTSGQASSICPTPSPLDSGRR